MTRQIREILPLLFFVASLQAAAQGCPPGQYPVAGQGWNYCAPVPGAAQEEASPQQATGPRWKNVWQSTAIDNEAGALGTAMGRSTAKDAERGAVDDCKDKGGTNCVVQVSMKNGCIAIVVGDKMFNVKGGSTEEETVGEAMAECKATNSTCTLFYKKCDFAVRVQSSFDEDPNASSEVVKDPTMQPNRLL